MRYGRRSAPRGRRGSYGFARRGRKAPLRRRIGYRM